MKPNCESFVFVKGISKIQRAFYRGLLRPSGNRDGIRGRCKGTALWGGFSGLSFCLSSGSQG